MGKIDILYVVFLVLFYFSMKSSDIVKKKKGGDVD